MDFSTAAQAPVFAIVVVVVLVVSELCAHLYLNLSLSLSLFLARSIAISGPPKSGTAIARSPLVVVVVAAAAIAHYSLWQALASSGKLWQARLMAFQRSLSFPFHFSGTRHSCSFGGLKRPKL